MASYIKRMLGIITDETDFENILRKGGLDSKKWIPLLEKELKVTSIKALKHMGEGDFQKLSPHTDVPWEKQALRTLFNLPSEKDFSPTEGTQKHTEWKENQKRLGGAMEKLKKLEQEGKERNDKAVEEQEDKIRELLDVPDSVWISKDSSLKDLMKDLDKKMLVMSANKHDVKDKQSDFDLLKKASGGLALQGVFVKEYKGDFRYGHENMLKVPDDFSMSMPSLEQNILTEQCTSEESSAAFERSISKLGIRAGVSASLQTWSFGMGATVDASYSNDEEANRNSETHSNYISTSKICFLPMASCSFGERQMHLTSDVIADLKDLETAIDDELKPTACKNIFEKYGSHAGKGPIHFGGIYRWKSEISGEDKMNKEDARNLTSEALDIHVSAAGGLMFTAAGSMGFNASKFKGQFTGKYDESLMAKTTLSLNKLGGPPECDDLLQWKIGLAADNNTWAVIDKGERYIPIWELVLNHKEDFEDADAVRNILKDSFSKLFNPPWTLFQ